MLKRLRQLFLPVALAFIVVAYTGAYFSDSVTSSGNTFTAGVSYPTDIVLNEAMVNPAVETGSNPNGEWVELYNTGAWSINVSGWTIKDNSSNSFTISTANTNTGSTIIPSHGYLAVYRNGAAIFNNGGDTVNLYDGADLIDQLIYTSSIDSESWARIPNGTGAWSDGHTPTPGAPNV